MNNYEILKEYEAHKTPIPSYDKFQELNSKMKHLLDLQKNQDEEIEQLRKWCEEHLYDRDLFEVEQNLTIDDYIEYIDNWLLKN